MNKGVSDPFEILKNIQMLASEDGSAEFRNTLAGLYLLGVAIGTIGLAFSIIFCGLKLACIKNANTREETKKELMWKAVLGVLMFGFTAFLGIAYTVAASFKI